MTDVVTDSPEYAGEVVRLWTSATKPESNDEPITPDDATEVILEVRPNADRTAAPVLGPIDIIANWDAENNEWFYWWQTDPYVDEDNVGDVGTWLAKFTITGLNLSTVEFQKVKLKKQLF